MTNEELIRRSDAIDAVEEGMCTFYDCYVIEKLKEVSTVEPKRGKWIPVDNGHHVRCSECGRCGFASDNYCGNCGAKMKGADDE